MLLLKGAKIYPVVGDVLEEGMILVGDDGKIKEIGKEISAPDDAEILDLTDKVVIPGLIDCHSHLGIWGDGEGPSSYDGNESVDPITPQIRAIESANPLQSSFEAAREGGITTVQILPGSSNPIGGLGFVCKTYGNIIDEMTLKNPSALKGALGENPKRNHGQNRKQAPFTRMGIASLIRNYFYEAAEYGQRKEKAEVSGEPFCIDLKYESGLKVLKKEIPFRIHAHRQDDIVTAIRLCEELDIDYSIEHCTEGHLIAEYLGKKKVTAMVGPGLSAPQKTENARLTNINAAILNKAGVKVCLITDHPFLNCRYFLHYAAIAYKYGLPFEEAMKSITLYPAEALGIRDRVGSLEVGKDADFVVLGGEPFTLKGRVEATYIEGRCVWKRELY